MSDTTQEQTEKIVQDLRYLIVDIENLETDLETKKDNLIEWLEDLEIQTLTDDLKQDIIDKILDL